MKFALNGAVTVGTYDGANIEIREAVGADNFYLFGLTEEQIREKRMTYIRVKYMKNQNILSAFLMLLILIYLPIKIIRSNFSRFSIRC
jgi:starch phosphorylase